MSDKNVDALLTLSVSVHVLIVHSKSLLKVKEFKEFEISSAERKAEICQDTQPWFH